MPVFNFQFNNAKPQKFERKRLCANLDWERTSLAFRETEQLGYACVLTCERSRPHKAISTLDLNEQELYLSQYLLHSQKSQMELS